MSYPTYLKKLQQGFEAAVDDYIESWSFFGRKQKNHRKSSLITQGSIEAYLELLRIENGTQRVKLPLVKRTRALGPTTAKRQEIHSYLQYLPVTT